MSGFVSEEVREFVRFRAERLCEYCLLHEDDSLFTHRIDHIISIKHGGLAVAENLSLACIVCNRHKGSDVGTILATGAFTRFNNPRLDSWPDHFRLEGGVIEAVTAIGDGTARILKFNAPERIMEREELAARGRYPSLQALARMRR
jgi:hypothetical protein